MTGVFSSLWVFALFFSASAMAQESAINPQSFDVNLCSSPNLSDCKCPEGCTPIETRFGSSYRILKGTCYRCVSSNEALKDFLIHHDSSVSKKCPDEDQIISKSGSTELMGLPENVRDLENFPNNCGYKMAGFNISAYRTTLQKLIVSSNNQILCNHAMCTSATFLYFVKQIKKLKEKGLITEETFNSWSKFPSDPKNKVCRPWALINDNPRGDLLADCLVDKNGNKIAEGKFLDGSELATDNTLRPGDIFQFSRFKNKKGQYTGHSTVFLGYLNDENGKRVGVCYWSANQGSKVSGEKKDKGGYGKKCEPLSTIENFTTMRFIQ